MVQDLVLMVYFLKPNYKRQVLILAKLLLEIRLLVAPHQQT